MHRGIRAGLRRRLVALLAGLVLACGPGGSERDGAGGAASEPAGGAGRGAGREAASASAAEAPRFVGSEACTGCHADESARWTGSQHRAAMALATPASVKAPFAGERLALASGAVRFVRDGEAFVVERESAARAGRERAGGERAGGGDEGGSPMRIGATFGIEPLQQFLLEAVDGRIQVLPWAFDTRAASEGGQRWLDLYPDAADPADPLHFSRPAQNWNHVCADCHVTGFRKRFDAEGRRFDSKWQELGVGCESCHGPGSRHLAWADSKSAVAEARAGGDVGLVARLDERRDVVWTIDPETGDAVRSRPRTSSRELDVCAPCHARRTAISEDWVAGEAFLDHYRPTLLDRGLYQADGQQLDEVYDWGSFLQSRMHAKGVTCSDCHDPHSGGLRAEGDALCAGCHVPERHATEAHHHHPPESPGARCVACHMPTTTYMQVDPRHDHSLRVPRPDQARALGVPDACTGCHARQGADFAAAAVERWLGRPARGFERHAEAIHAAETDAIDAGPRLRTVAADATQPTIVRATALARLDAARGRASAEALVAATRDGDPLVRLGALEGLANAPDDVRLRAAGALLDDPRRAVRFDAVRVVAPVAGGLSAAGRAAFEREARAYVASLRRDADRAEARTQLGVFLAEQGDAEGARLELEAALALEPAFEAAHVNLADLERALGRDDAALAVLDAGLARLPESAALHHARGLARIRLGASAEALVDLARAAAIAPDSSRFGYVHAVALESMGDRAGAIARLEALAKAHPGDPALREALIGYLEAEGSSEAARDHRAALARIAESER